MTTFFSLYTLLLLLLTFTVDALTSTRYRELVSKVKGVIASNPLRDPGDESDGDTYGAYVRMVFHDAGTYDEDVAQSGAHGCLLYPCGLGNECQYNAGENRGLETASDLILYLYNKWELSTEMTRADFLYLVGNSALEASLDEAGEPYPAIGFRTGRSDCEGFPTFPDALPSAEVGTVAETRRVFGRLNFNDAEAMTLIGAHTLGRCLIPNSGFELPWVNHPDKFDARYFDWMIGREWILRTNSAGKLQWFRDNEFMMLNADLNLAFNIDNCDNSENCPRGPLYDLAEQYADDDAFFIKQFVPLFQRLSEKTQDVLVDLDGPPLVGKAAGEEADEEEEEEDDEDDEEDFYYRYAIPAVGFVGLFGVVTLAKSRAATRSAGRTTQEENNEDDLADTSSLEEVPSLDVADFLTHESPALLEKDILSSDQA